ncbi:retrovirus-related pol polyprotein from transposon TNT 1-94 [Tanacetum coccineum]|uniref:Retrovirus-related pol polyprotein from transposon TNT 1-94 n=1 Tax=Tanacetum coccineum TaxID=301880 RepID=A0ABQ5AV63_9ASTR
MQKFENSRMLQAQWIKPTLYAGSVISRQHDVIPVTDEEETLILEEAPRELPKLNSKSMENADLKGQIQEKVFRTTALQNELWRLKGVICSTSTSGSKPTDNTKNSRIWWKPTGRTFTLVGKSKKHSHKPKAEDPIQEKLYLLHMDLCGPMMIQSINGKKYILVIVDDYSQFMWAKFLRSKDEVPEFNDVFKRQNRTLVEAARTMLIFSKAPLFLCALCYPTNDSEDFGKLQPKADIGIFVGYALAKKAFWIYNRRTCLIIETIHVTFDEPTIMAPATLSLGLVPNPPFPTPVGSPVPVAVAPVAADSTGTPSSTLVDQDAPSPIAHMDSDQCFSLPIPKPSSEESSSHVVIPNNMHSVNQPPEHISKWTKGHPIDNGYKEALTKSCWIEAMQEELNDFECLEV